MASVGLADTSREVPLIGGGLDVRSLTDWVEEQAIPRVDLKIGDLSGRLRHISLPSRKLGDALANGVGFAGRHYGFSGPMGEDLVMFPDPGTAWLDPFLEIPAVSLFAQPRRAGDGGAFDRDPRAVAERAEKHLRDAGIGTDSRWLPEFEFYVGPPGAGTADQPAFGANGFLDRYHASPPWDRHAGFRARAVDVLEGARLPVKYDHHESGGAGQMEVELDFGGLVETADGVLLTKYILRNLAAREGLEAVFLPKPSADAPGNGLHVHVQVVDEGSSVFSGDSYGGLSKVALRFIGGILIHLRSLAAFTNPSTNSYRRLVPGMEAPIRTEFAIASRTAAIRIPGYVAEPEARRFEYRPLDATSNPYLAFAAILMAGIDGVRRELDPSALGFGPFDGDGRHETSPQTSPLMFPRSLDEALDALEEDHEYLSEAGVFPDTLLQEWLALKRQESERLELQPHPAELQMYGDL